MTECTELKEAARQLLLQIVRINGYTLESTEQNPGFRGWENGYGEDMGDALQDALEALARFYGDDLAAEVEAKKEFFESENEGD